MIACRLSTRTRMRPRWRRRERRADARKWIIKNQLGRRNLTLEQWDYLLGEKYNREKGNREDNLKQNQPNAQNEQSDTATRLAEEHKVSRASVVRAGQFAEAVDTLTANVGEEVKQKILTGDTTGDLQAH